MRSLLTGPSGQCNPLWHTFVDLKWKIPIRRYMFFSWPSNVKFKVSRYFLLILVMIYHFFGFRILRTIQWSFYGCFITKVFFIVTKVCFTLSVFETWEDPMKNKCLSSQRVFSEFFTFVASTASSHNKNCGVWLLTRSGTEQNIMCAKWDIWRKPIWTKKTSLLHYLFAHAI